MSQGDAGGTVVETIITYLEMTAPPDRPPPVVRPGIEVRRATAPTLSFYRYLYDTIGADWLWTQRRRMPAEALIAVLRDPAVEINVLWVAGVPAGYAELDWRHAPEVELAYFGLIPEYIGQGLGGFLLDWAIARAWRTGPRRLWVHTCDLDHPNALAVYQKAGFRAYDRQIGREVLLPGMELPRHRRH